MAGAPIDLAPSGHRYDTARGLRFLATMLVGIPYSISYADRLNRMIYVRTNPHLRARCQGRIQGGGGPHSTRERAL